MATVVGSVTWTLDEGEATATLRSDGSWSFAGDPLLAAPLRTTTEHLRYAGPQEGAFGARMLRDLAEAVGGQIERSALAARPDPESVAY